MQTTQYTLYKIPIALVAILVMVFAALQPNPVQAAGSITVDTFQDGYPATATSLREAIEAEYTDIYLPAGVYNVDTDTYGMMNIRYAPTIYGDGPSATIVRGTNQLVALAQLRPPTGQTVVLRDLAFENLGDIETKNGSWGGAFIGGGNGIIHIENARFENNGGQFGTIAMLQGDPANLNIVNSSFINNVPRDIVTTRNVTTISDSYLSGGVHLEGGYFTTQYLTVTNTTFDTAPIFVYPDTYKELTFDHVTFVGGAIATWGNGGGSQATFTNSLLTDSCRIIAQSGGGNVFANSDCAAQADALASDIVTTQTVGTLFEESAQLNGGLTPNFALPTSSDAINASVCLSTVTTDQRGVGRPEGAQCDAGAFEYQAPPTSLVAELAPETLITTPLTTHDIQLSWNDNAEFERAYMLEHSSDGGTTWALVADDLPANTESYVHADQLCETIHSYRVRGVYTGYSNVDTVTTPSCPANESPLNLTAVYDALVDAVDLTWNDAATNEEAYVVERSADGGTTWGILTDSLPADSIAYTDTDVVCDTTYSYRVKAVNSGGDSAYSNVASTYTIDCIPVAPSDFTVVYDAEQHITIATWTDNSLNETAFEIERIKPLGSTPWVVMPASTPNATQMEDHTVTCDQQYAYRLRAVNGDYVSDWITSESVNTACDIFTDLQTGSIPPAFEPWIEDFAQEGLTYGCRPLTVDTFKPGVLDTFCPDAPVRRAELAVFLLRTINWQGNFPHDTYVPASQAHTFEDVPSPNMPASFEAYIAEFLNLGFTIGCQRANDVPTHYCPEQSLTRGELAVFMVRYLDDRFGRIHYDGAPPNPFVDVPSPNQPAAFEGFISRFYELGLTTGCAGSTPGEDLRFCPDEALTRAEIAVFLLRAFDDIPNPDHP